MSNLLEAVDLHKSYRVGGEELWVLKSVNLTVNQGEVLAVLGASGAGKSTLLHILGALDSPSKGTVLLRGESITNLRARDKARVRNKTFGFVFQFYHLLPELTALENVVLPSMVGLPVQEWRRRKRSFLDTAISLLQKVELGRRLRHRPSQLSGGERQRVAIARALMNSPEILLCDEPTGNLDSAAGNAIKELLWGLRREKGLTLLIVTHSQKLAEEADRIERIADGIIVP